MKLVGWLLIVHVTVGTDPPDEVQEMLTLSPSETVTVALVPAAVLGESKCLEYNNHNVLSERYCTKTITYGISTLLNNPNRIDNRKLQLINTLS